MSCGSFWSSVKYCPSTSHSDHTSHYSGWEPPAENKHCPLTYWGTVRRAQLSSTEDQFYITPTILSSLCLMLQWWAPSHSKHRILLMWLVLIWTSNENLLCKNSRQHRAEHSFISDENLHHVAFNSTADMVCVESSQICNEIQDLQLCWLMPGEQTSGRFYKTLTKFCLSSLPYHCFDMVLRLLFNHPGSKGQVCTIITEVLTVKHGLCHLILHFRIITQCQINRTNQNQT